MKEEKRQKIQEQLEQICRQILVRTRNQLYLQMRFLDVALSGFRFAVDRTADPAATDGFVIYCHPARIGGLYRESPVELNRLYLHMVLHCLFRHLIRRNKRDARLWNLSCDIAAESVMDSMKARCITEPRSYLRQETYRKLKERMPVLTAEKIYSVLAGLELSERKLAGLEKEFQRDSHQYWPDDSDQKRQQEIENRWKDRSEKTQTQMETFSRDSSSSSGDLLAQVRVENRERFDYRDFLRKFAVLKEEVSVDQDSFDYVFYSYGLSLYGNMPLIEPQEWKETKKIEEFVIVVDTSMSCSGELVRQFLEETYDVLTQQDAYFHKVNIHIIQCDDQVRNDQKITSGEELKNYMENLELAGEGGTDFRPAFEYVEELMKNHEFTHLKGLLYFTDGQGIYPKKMPLYKTAFVFLGDDYEEAEVPSWAIRLVLPEDAFKDR